MITALKKEFSGSEVERNLHWQCNPPVLKEGAPDVEDMMSPDIQKFVKACIIKGEADEFGDSRKGNRQYKTIRSVYEVLKSNLQIVCLFQMSCKYCRYGRFVV